VNIIISKQADLEGRGFRLTRARLQDVPQMHEVINRFADLGEMLPRSMSELYENIRDFLVIKQEDGDVAATASLHVLWEDLAEIKSVAVTEDLQGQGIGAFLVEKCAEDAASLGLETIFVLTHKPGFYEKLGFQRADVLDFPRKVWSECIRCPKFPSCNEIAMSRPVAEQVTGLLPED
jgi:amino-acid N-acetyltransferase